jgi:hypothetical protein
MSNKKDFPLEKGLEIQAQQLLDWKPKLAPKLYEDLVAYANSDKENWSDGFDVKRGVTLSNFIQNWEDKPNFNLSDELDALQQELDGQEINGLIFVGERAQGGAWHLSFKANVPSMKSVNIFCTPFAGVDGITFQIENNKAFVPCKRPTSYEEFDSWKKFYIGQLFVVQGKFATVSSVEVNHEEKTYTVDGFLIPKQTNDFDEYSDWDCLVDYNGNPIVDCQIDLDEDLQFQFVDYNYVIDAKEGESEINLDDTENWGFGTYSCRNYRGCGGDVKLVNELHELTERLLEQFYITYSTGGKDDNDETRILLDKIIRDSVK